MYQYNIGNVQMKDFYFEDEPLLMPKGTEMRHNGIVWGLYVNYDLDTSFVVTKGLQNGLHGWRVRIVPGIMAISYAEGYVKQRCGECLGLR